MNAFKNLLPVLVLLAFSVYGYRTYTQWPDLVIHGVVFLPVVLALLVVGLAVHFNRSPVFFYSALAALTHLVLALDLAGTELSYGLLSAVLPPMFLVLTLLPERGIFSARAVPAHAVLLSGIAMCVVVAVLSPEWAKHAVLSEWLPARYFDWTPLPQTALFVFVAVFLAMLVLYFTRPTPHLAAGLGVLVILVAQLHCGTIDQSVNVFGSTAQMACLYAVLQESWRMAYLDELTELPGRRALREKFQKLGGAYAVAMIDVDHFKKFNDTHGHDAGDAVLRMVAARLGKVTGGGAPYRYGGEEFSVVFNGKNREEAHPHLEALREKIELTPFIVNRASRRKSDNRARRSSNRSVTVTVSIGVADTAAGASSPWDVLKLADKALYRAKNQGRNRVCG